MITVSHTIAGNTFRDTTGYQWKTVFARIAWVFQIKQATLLERSSGSNVFQHFE